MEAISIGAIIWGIGSLAKRALKGIEALAETAKNIVSHVTSVRNDLRPKDGRTLEAKIEETDKRRQEVIAKYEDPTEKYKASRNVIILNHLFYNPFDIDSRKVLDIGQNPSIYDLREGQRLVEARNLNLYKPNPIAVPIIFRDSNFDLIIANIPVPVLRNIFVRPSDLPQDLNWTSVFGITSNEILPEVTQWFNMLNREDQIYFPQLYKDYYELTQSIGQHNISSRTEFFHKLYIKRDQIIRETGVPVVLFDLKVDTDNRNVKHVVVQSRPVQVKRR